VRDAVLFDIHGNFDALEAVLREADACGCERLLVGGDLAYMGPEPDAVVDRLRAEGDRVIAVRGNTDRMIAADDDDVARWAADLLGLDRVLYLGGLPERRHLPEHGALLVHATPRSDEERLLPETPEPIAAAMVAGEEVATVLCGHVHIQYRRVVGEIEVVNPGSVGIPFDGDPRAAWAIVDDGDVTLQRTEYDQSSVLARLAALTSHPARALAERRLRDARP